MAGFDTIDIAVTGCGGYAAMLHDCTDSIVASGQLIGALQSVVSRAPAPQSPAVLSVRPVHAGDVYNLIPETVRLAGCARYFHEAVKARLQKRTTEICEGIATQQKVAGADAVNDDQNPSMASEDFAVMLEQAPGAYIWLGNGPVSGFGARHTPRDDFNDAVLRGIDRGAKGMKACRGGAR